MTAPPPSALSTDYILEEMKKVSKTVLEKHLDCRRFISEKVKIWGDDIISEIYSILSQKYPQYGFCFFFICLKLQLMLQMIAVFFIMKQMWYLLYHLILMILIQKLDYSQQKREII